jgi:hypothetical protein
MVATALIIWWLGSGAGGGPGANRGETELAQVLPPAVEVPFPVAPAALTTGRDEDRALGLPHARRARAFEVPADFFTAKDSPFWARAGEARMELELFADVIVPVRVTRAEVLGPGRYGATGEIEGSPGSRVLFAMRDGSLSALIDDLSRGRFEIFDRGEGRHVVQEIDLSRVPPCGGTLPMVPDVDATAYYAERARALIARANQAAPPAAAGHGESSGGIAGAERPPDIVMDLLVAYSSEVRLSGWTTTSILSRIDLAVAEVNSDLARSNVRARVRLAHAVEVNAGETGSMNTLLNRLRRTNDGWMDEIHQLLDEHGADLVTLLFQRPDPAGIGLAYLLREPNDFFNQSFAFSVVEWNFAVGTSTLTHELGHNLGCAHDRDNASTGGTYSYSYGHRFTPQSGGLRRTIMAYSPGQRAPYFSNPRLVWPGDGLTPMGVPGDLPGAADNARTIDQNAFEVANYRLAAVAAFGRGQLINVSTRARVGQGERQLIGGFVVTGQPKQILLRGQGPSLAGFGLAGTLSDPILELRRQQDGSFLAANETWTLPTAAAAGIAATGLAPGDGREPALLVTLPEGLYTAQLYGTAGTEGVGLVEVFEVGRGSSRIVNLSTRGWVGAGEDVMIAGFVVEGQPGETKRILLRALGPSLEQYGIAAALFDPAMRLYDAKGELLLDNDDWDYSNKQNEIRELGLAPGNRREPAMLLDLEPGLYTAIVRPFENPPPYGIEPGVGLVEVYEIKP